MNFYSYVSTYGNNILHRHVSHNRDLVEKVPFKPTLFVKAKTKNTEWKSLYDDPVEPIKFSDISDARNFIKKYEDVVGFDIFGSTSFEDQFIAESYPEDINFDFSQFKIVTIDIETELPPIGDTEGFPNIETANTPINLITILNNQTKEITTIGCKPWQDKTIFENAEKVEGYSVNYFQVNNEQQLLQKFISIWSANYPHFFTGWNTETFDTPYLINRIVRLLGESEAKKLSPFGLLKSKKISIYNKDVQVYEIVGIPELDYLSLYKKYTYGSKESYSLEAISTEELNIGKLKFNCSFREAYETQWDKFVAYNIIDTIRVKQIDEKLQFLLLAVVHAYMMKCNFKDIFGTVKPWDCMIHYHLWHKKIAIPKKKSVEGFEIEGGYVKEPKPGLYGWIMSFDYNSLYPSIIRQWNISPETISKIQIPMTKQNIIDEKLPDEYSIYKDEYSIAANGTMYYQEKKGIIPELMEYLMNGRKVVKKKMLELEQELQLVKEEIAKLESSCR